MIGGVLYDVLLAVDFVWSTTVPVYNAFFLLIKQLAMSLFDQIVYCDKEVRSAPCQSMHHTLLFLTCTACAPF